MAQPEDVLYEKYDMSFLVDKSDQNRVILNSFNKSNLPMNAVPDLYNKLGKISPTADPEKYEITETKTDEQIKEMLSEVQKNAPAAPAGRGVFGLFGRGGKRVTKRARYMKKGGKSRKHRASRK
jgi:hypothetical protein